MEIYQAFKIKISEDPTSLAPGISAEAILYYIIIALKELIFRNICFLGTSLIHVARYMLKTVVSFTRIYLEEQWLASKMFENL